MSTFYGYIHSIESMSVHDGPGIRTVVYFQGCPLRCAYCHNPDTWTQGADMASCDNGTMKYMSVEEVIEAIIRYRLFFERSGGGVTFSGGEVLMQPEFLLALLKACRDAGIHTAIETSGYGLELKHLQVSSVLSDAIIESTDLVILDVKEPLLASGNTGHKRTAFMTSLCEAKNRRLWLRYVKVPGVSDGPEYSKAVESFAKTMGRVEKIEPLTYHTMGVYKYEALGLEYPLAFLSASMTEATNK